MGQSLAKVSLAATMAVLLQHFSFRLADEVPPPPFLLSGCCCRHTFVAEPNCHAGWVPSSHAGHWADVDGG